MITITPFRALRPAPSIAASLASVPYDVVDRIEATTLAELSPHSFLRVSRSEIELPGEDPYSTAVYEHARENLNRLIEDGSMSLEAEPSIYVYRMEAAGHVQTGIAARFSIDDYKAGRIKKHELTRPDKEDDRIRHIDVVDAQTGPVLLFHKHAASPGIAQLLDETAAHTASLYDVPAADGVRHQIFRVGDPVAEARLVALFKSMDSVYIADGHHRAASAARVSELRKSRGGESDFGMLAVCFPDAELKILAYNRAVRDLHGQDANSFLTRVGQIFQISEKRGPPGPREFGLYTGGRWYLLSAPPSLYAGASVTDALDVSILQNHLLKPVLGIDDPRSSERITFVGGGRGEGELERLVDSAGHAVSFSLHPVTPADLISAADAGLIMPPKSTWFEPKLRDGFLVNVLGRVG